MIVLLSSGLYRIVFCLLFEFIKLSSNFYSFFPGSGPNISKFIQMLIYKTKSFQNNPTQLIQCTVTTNFNISINITSSAGWIYLHRILLTHHLPHFQTETSLISKENSPLVNASIMAMAEVL